MANDAQMPELLPCPFCGGAARAFETQNDSEFQAQVQCSGCGAEFVFWLPWTAGYGDRSKAMGDVMHRWNRRAALCASGQVRALADENSRLNDAMLVLGAYLMEKGEAFRVGEGAELLDAYHAALTPAPQAEVGEGDRIKVPAGQTPLNDKLGHRLLDVFNEGVKARDEGTGSPYHGHSLEHCLHATGWVQRDLRLALDAARAALRALKGGEA